jgi:hypothetical protein
VLVFVVFAPPTLLSWQTTVPRTKVETLKPRFLTLARYGLDAELKNKRDAALDPRLEQEAREWVAAVGGTPIGADLAASLNDGVLL